MRETVRVGLAAVGGLLNRAHAMRAGPEADKDKWIPTKGELSLIGGHGANLLERHLHIEGDLDAVDLFGVFLGGGLYGFRNITGTALIPEDDELKESVKDNEAAFTVTRKAPTNQPTEQPQPEVA